MICWVGEAALDATQSTAREHAIVGYECGRGQLGRAIRGSVLRYCLAHARCPVLAVPPPDMIRELRFWPRHWRPQDFAAPQTG